MANILGVWRAQKKVTMVLEGIARSRNMLQKLGEMSVERIYQQTKTGYGVSGRQKVKLAPLSPWYRKYREYYQANAKTGDFFAPARSNATLSGQMLEALIYRIDQARGKVQVLVASTARAIYYPMKRRKNAPPEDLTNAQVADRYISGGRPFLGLDRQAEQRLRSEVIKEFKRVLRREALRR